MAEQKPAFSAGMITGVVTVFWLIVFGLVMNHGMNGIHQAEQAPASSQQAKAK